MILACSPKTCPISRSPSHTALTCGLRVDRAITPNGCSPPGAPAPDGGENTTVAVTSCWG